MAYDLRGAKARVGVRVRPIQGQNNQAGFTFPDDTSHQDIGNINLENNKLDSFESGFVSQ